MYNRGYRIEFNKLPNRNNNALSIGFFFLPKYVFHSKVIKCDIYHFIHINKIFLELI